MSRNTFGQNLSVTIFGESHGPAIGAVIDGLPSGLKIDMDYLADQMNKRKAAGKISTARHEADLPEFISGLKDGYTEGTPLTLIIRNENVRAYNYLSIRHFLAFALGYTGAILTSNFWIGLVIGLVLGLKNRRDILDASDDLLSQIEELKG